MQQLDQIAETLGISSETLGPLTDFFTETCGVEPKQVVWVHNVEDFVAIPTLYVATKTKGSRAIGEPFRLGGQPPITHGMAVNGGFVFGTERAVESLRTGTPSPRPDLTIPLENLDKSQLGFVLAPGKATRRVLRESFPSLPSPFKQITGELLADEIRTVQLSVNSRLPVKIDLEIQGASESAPVVVEQAIDDVIALSQQAKTASAIQGTTKILASALRSMERQRSGSSLSLRVSSKSADAFKNVLSSSFNSVVEKSNGTHSD